jgi:hypothetical protein
MEAKFRGTTFTLTMQGNSIISYPLLFQVGKSAGISHLTDHSVLSSTECWQLSSAGSFVATINNIEGLCVSIFFQGEEIKKKSRCFNSG